MELVFTKISGLARGTLYALLLDSYSFDKRYKACFERDWREFDDFFFDNPDIADKYGFITVLNGVPIGLVSWDPRNRPEYVRLGHNCIVCAHKGKGFGKKQLFEAVERIKAYEGLRKIVVQTNSALIAPHNYESVGFKLIRCARNESESAFSGDFLDYELELR